MELDKHSKKPLKKPKYTLYLQDVEKVVNLGVRKYASTTVFDEPSVVAGINHFLDSQAKPLLVKLNHLSSSKEQVAVVIDHSEDDEEEKRINLQMGKPKSAVELAQLEAQQSALTMKRNARKVGRLENVRRIMECSTKDQLVKYDAKTLARTAMWFKNLIMSLQNIMKEYPGSNEYSGNLDQVQRDGKIKEGNVDVRVKNVQKEGQLANKNIVKPMSYLNKAKSGMTKN
uniref:uncharacterized protein LOC122599964 n=1 Tax=Erigeron canadensis TaxID=72917 RepID=UPI001CB9AAAA|nr:uncharacterized protein LOC122599964 [Erigeron canadensis]